ncbi:MAG: AAA family ATPase, partial [Nitrososphaerota archaeon]|nr:AAA family ATPase [Nitrososphaerota archaeon]
MIITNVNVLNYRNIDGIKVTLHPDCNYIIGKNNIGKSNCLSLLSTICNGYTFENEDFLNTEKPIEVEIKIKLSPKEYGFFGDNFSPEDSSSINIRYRQAIQDPYPSIVCVDTNESISRRAIQKINYMQYETTSIPSRKLRLDTQEGAGLLINNFISRFLDSNSKPVFLNDEQIVRLKDFINDRLNKIKSFREYSIEAAVASDPIELLTSMFYLSDGSRKIATTASGVQFIAMASINILCQIMTLYNDKAVPFKERLYTDDNGKKILSLVLSIDEPEVHLHPYLQRSLIGFYKRILKNKDPEFVDLLKQCFDIDGIDGQLIIVTHSTDALIGDYRSIIRFYKKEGNVSVICGYDTALQLDANNKKHLIMHFPEIKEVFYANCAILIEGETEYGCIHNFADKLGISLDDYGICVINARGEGAIPSLQRLLDVFKVRTVAIYDKDVETGQTPADNEFYTQELCFEVEIVKAFCNGEQADLIKQIACDLDHKAASQSMTAEFVRNSFKKMNIPLDDGYVTKKLSDIDDKKDKEEFIRLYAA